MGCYLRKTPFAGILNSTMRNNSGPVGAEPGKVMNYEFFVNFLKEELLHGERLGYAAQDGETGKYRLTLKMFEISSGIVNSMDVMSVAKVHLERLAQRTGEAVHLVIRDAQDIVYIYKTESGPMRMSSRVGLRSPLYCTGVGKAILATLTEEEVEDVWRHSSPQKLTVRTVTDLPALCAQLNEVRACGYAIDDEENELGIRCVALAIPGPGGKADSAFSISGLAPYMTPERIRRIAALALETRADILRDLGVQGV